MGTIKTNADAIRSKTDEELAAWIKDILYGGIERFDKMMCDQCKVENGGSCPHSENDLCGKGDNYILEWLRQGV